MTCHLEWKNRSSPFPVHWYEALVDATMCSKDREECTGVSVFGMR